MAVESSEIGWLHGHGASTDKPPGVVVRLFCVFLICSAVLFDLAFWFVHTQTGMPDLRARPHPVVDLILYRNVLDKPAPYELLMGETAGDALVDYASRVFALVGNNRRLILAFQLPFLVLLLASVTTLGGRLGGWYGAVLACFAAATAPTTIGTALECDNLLAVQALVAASIALLVFSLKPGRAILALPAGALLKLVRDFSVLHSHSILAFAFVFAVVLTIFLLYFKRFGRSTLRPQKLAPVVLWLIGFGYAAIQFQGGGTGSYYWYIRGEVSHAIHEGFSLGQTLLAYPTQWLRVQAGGAVGAATIAAIIIAAIKRRLGTIAPFLVWLLFPMLFLGLLAKRNDYYAVAALPAAFVLIGAGFGMVRKFRVALGVLVVGLMFCHFLSLTAWPKAQLRPPTPAQLASLDLRGVLPTNWGFREETVWNYAKSPYHHNWQQPIATEVAAHCNRDKTPLLYIQSFGANEMLDFGVWFANPGLVPFNVLYEDPGRLRKACLLVAEREGASLDWSLEQILRFRFKEGAQLPRESYKASYYWLLERSPKFRVVKRFRFHTLYRWDE